MDDSEGKDVGEHHEDMGLADGSKDLDNGRPGRRTSKVWTIFNRLTDNNAQCNVCSRILSYKSSVTNLAKHIQRRHPSAWASVANEEDPTEGLREFITIDTGRSKAASDNEAEEDPIRTDDSDWLPPTKSAKKSSLGAKKIKKEVISSNGVDYVIYTHDHPTPTPTRQSISTRKTPAASQRSTAARAPIVTSTPIRTSPPPVVMRPVDEDEFSTFARFLSQRIRALKNPYWQSCAINEINSALHRIEMRRYEVPKVDSAQSFVQTDPIAVAPSPVDETVHHEHVVEVIAQDMA